MVDLSNMPDDQLDAMISAQSAPISSAILGQESNNNPNSPTSVNGAVGAAQIEPATFAQYAKPGEDINNPEDNIAVHHRIIADLSTKAGGDPARVAVGYFSGPGNIAPPSSPTPWKADHKDGNGKSVSSYVSDVLGRLNPVSNANASEPAVGSVPSSTAASPLSTISDEDLDAQIAKLQSKNAPSILASAVKPIKDIIPSMNEEANSGIASMTRPFPESTGSVGGDLLAGEKDVLGRALGAAQWGFSPVTGAIHALVGQPASGMAQSLGMSPENAKTYIQNPIEMAANIATPMGVEKYAPELAAGAGSILDKLKNNSFIQNELSTQGPFLSSTRAVATKAAPTIDPRTAQIVQDASDLGINIPPRVFNPGSTSNALNKVGLMSDGTMKSDITTALSKAMGHEGTPNLDINTMEGIQNTIGSKMNDFAMKADANGGIPVATTDLQNIADNSYADAPKIDKLMAKVTDKIGDNGTISGKDYQSLTKKGGALDKALHSSDSDFADTAKELRAHLDDKLESAVSPDDLSAFKDARRQYRTMKIVQPLVESGGVTGQADSAPRLFNAVSKNYGGINNALKYNPDLGKIAQIANEFPEALKDVPKTSLLAKATGAATIPAAIGIGTSGYLPAGLTAAAAVPAAKGVASYLSSPFYKEAILGKSLPDLLPELAEQMPKYAHGGIVAKRKAKLYEKHASALKDKLGRVPKEGEIELAHYVGAHGVKRLLSQKDTDLHAHKMFPKDVVDKNRKLFFENRRPYKVAHIQSML